MGVEETQTGWPLWVLKKHKWADVCLKVSCYDKGEKLYEFAMCLECSNSSDDGN